ncbi:MAG: DUF1599 domain-containing protein [Flavobacteriales bacterium TMED191]|nr:MAG: DUF1599 domain-containing protein [Flavobacteriales bacterium TMED191]|tara:strand:- start:1540 stop:2076 length:537 start_codon:yes stop_codon:yes gene_type:complete
MNTEDSFDLIINNCRKLFNKKMLDYGSAWRILRLSSLTDQIFIKAQRIRSIEEKGKQQVNDSVEGEFQGIINYSIIALIQIDKGLADNADLNLDQASELYHNYVSKAKTLMLAKNHDYDEAWRDMRVSSFTDLILQKLLRVKQIEDNQGETIVSEGIDANYFDMINYSIFALIKLTKS